MRYIFCDTNPSVLEAFNEVFTSSNEGITTYNGSAFDLLEYNIRDSVFVCPIDSICSLQTMFINNLFNFKPNIIEEFKLLFECYGSLDANKRKIIKIGSAIAIILNFDLNQHVIFVPTTKYPDKIEDDNSSNIYYAFLAVLNLVNKMKVGITTIISPGLGTGVGQLEPIEAVKQMASSMIITINSDKSPEIPFFYDADNSLLFNKFKRKKRKSRRPPKKNKEYDSDNESDDDTEYIPSTEENSD